MRTIPGSLVLLVLQNGRSTPGQTGNRERAMGTLVLDFPLKPCPWAGLGTSQQHCHLHGDLHESRSLLSPAPQIWPMLVSVVPCCHLLTRIHHNQSGQCGHSAQSWEMHATENCCSESWPRHHTSHSWLGLSTGLGIELCSHSLFWDAALSPCSEEGFARWMHHSSLCKSSLTYRMYRINSLLSLRWVYTPTVCTDIEYI